MGIDGVGGSRPPLGPPGGVGEGPAVGGSSGGGATGAEPGRGAQSTEGALGTEDALATEGAKATEAAARPEDVMNVDRARLERGELSLDDYLEIQVQEATSHLVDRLPATALDAVRAELRVQLATDPVLRSLAARITTTER
jgi:hypothetical protein